MRPARLCRAITTPTWLGRAPLYAAAISCCVLPVASLVRVHKGVFSQRCSKGGTTRARWAMGAFRALVATNWTGIGKRAVEGGLICLFFIGLQSGAAKPV